MKTLFKVVRSTENGFFSAYSYGFALKYSLGGLTEAPGRSLIFCFNNIVDAREFIAETSAFHHRVILLCYTEDEVKFLRWRANSPSSLLDVEHFWNGWGFSNRDVTYCPLGTVGVKRIVPIREIEPNENCL